MLPDLRSADVMVLGLRANVVANATMRCEHASWAIVKSQHMCMSIRRASSGHCHNMQA